MSERKGSTQWFNGHILTLQKRKGYVDERISQESSNNSFYLEESSALEHAINLMSDSKADRAKWFVTLKFENEKLREGLKRIVLLMDAAYDKNHSAQDACHEMAGVARAALDGGET